MGFNVWINVILLTAGNALWSIVSWTIFYRRWIRLFMSDHLPHGPCKHHLLWTKSAHLCRLRRISGSREPDRVRCPEPLSVPASKEYHGFIDPKRPSAFRNEHQPPRTRAACQLQCQFVTSPDPLTNLTPGIGQQNEPITAIELHCAVTRWLGWFHQIAGVLIYRSWESWLGIAYGKFIDKQISNKYPYESIWKFVCTRAINDIRHDNFNHR